MFPGLRIILWWLGVLSSAHTLSIHRSGQLPSLTKEVPPPSRTNEGSDRTLRPALSSSVVAWAASLASEPLSASLLTSEPLGVIFLFS